MTRRAAPASRAPVKPARRRARRGQGDELRGEILAATKSLLLDTGDSDAVSIRAVADAVGVTPPSIYLHFADKDALIDAVISDVFAALDVAMLAAAEGIEDPVHRLAAYGSAYIEFATAHPEHYRLATMQHSAVADHVASAVDGVLAENAFSHMIATVSECMAAGVFPAGDPFPVAMQLWTSVHGVAALMIAKPYLPWGDRAEFARTACHTAALGLAMGDTFDGTPDAAQVASWRAGRRATER